MRALTEAISRLTTISPVFEVSTVLVISSGIATISPKAVVFMATEMLAESRSAFSAGFALATAVKAWSQVQPALMNGDFDEARELTSQDDSAVSRLLAMGLARQGAVRRREDIEIAMEEGMMEIIPQLEKRTPYVALASSIATLLGLLGTIMGLIQAFTAVANANPAEKADLLSASISVAMNTTAFGLMAAIPLLLIYAVLQTKTTQLVDSLEMASVKFLNSLTDSPVSGTKAG